MQLMQANEGSKYRRNALVKRVLQCVSDHFLAWHGVCEDTGMKTAFSVWGQRIAPVFDTARQIHLVESDGTRITAEKPHALSGEDVTQKVAWLAAQGVATLVCGAVSRPLQEQLAAAGITVIPFVAGDLRQVIQASFDGTLSGAEFTMPGCCGRRRMRRQHGGGCCCGGKKTI